MQLMQLRTRAHGRSQNDGRDSQKAGKPSFVQEKGFHLSERRSCPSYNEGSIV